MTSSTGQETSGMLSTVFDSFKSNVEERLKSPFAGAFLISWLVINWKAVYILLLSDKTAEFRVKYVSEVFFSIWNTLWLPLIASLVAIIFFYFLSSVYLLIYEFYCVVKTKIEMLFDKVRWVSPTDYILAKKKNQDKYDSVIKLATDNTKFMDDARLRAEDAEARSADVQIKYQELVKNNEINSSKIEILEKTNIELAKSHEALNLLVSEKSKKNSLLSSDLIQANSLIEQALAQMESTYSKEVSKTLSLDNYNEALKNMTKDDGLKRKTLPDLTGGHLARLLDGGHTMENGRRLVEKLKIHINKQ